MKTIAIRNSTTIVLGSLFILLGGCATSGNGGGPELQRPQQSECPVGMMLICEGRNEPSRGGADEEIPNYDRCNCRIAPT